MANVSESELSDDYWNEDELVVPGVGLVFTIDYEVMLAAIGDDDGIVDIQYVVTELPHHSLDGLGVDEAFKQ